MPELEKLIVVLVIILLLFGAKKIPELARSIGESAREVRKGFNGEPSDSQKASNDKKKTTSK